MNEAEAGQNGRVRRQDDRLLLGDGREVRFWAVNVGPGIIAQSADSIDYMARRLAKAGVNMVRYHGPMFAAGADRAKVDTQRLDQLHYLVKALKQQGIYTTISFYFPVWFEPVAADGIDGFEKADGGRKSFAILYFDPRMQQIHRSWIKAILTSPNPHGGPPLGDDPAVAMVEIVNEDSLFFHTFARRNVPPQQWQRLEELFAAWAAQRYGTVEKTLAAWGDGRRPRDDAAAGSLELQDAWFMTRDGLQQARGAGRRKRVGDQIQFLAELQRGFYDDFVSYLRNELKFSGLVVAGNWHTADDHLLDAVERWTYAAGDVIDCHRYFGGRHDGEGSGYSVRVGHSFDDRSALASAGKHPLIVRQVAGYPQIISELGWPNPNRYRGESAFFTAAMASLQGIDGVYFFAVGSTFMADTGLSKFAVSSPAVFGAFPAAALMYRRGDLLQAPMAAVERIDLSRVYQLDAAVVDRPPVDPLTFATGPVAYRFVTPGDDQHAGDEAAKPAAADARQRQAVESPVVTAAGGQIVWHTQQGLMKIDAPRVQGAGGPLAACGVVETSDLRLTMGNAFANLLAISLDGQPLRSSRRVLLQTMTEEQPYGFRAKDNRITALGGWPFGVRLIQGEVELRTTLGRPSQVVSLDENGYARPSAVTWQFKRQPAADDRVGIIKLTLPQDALYTLVIW